MQPGISTVTRTRVRQYYLIYRNKKSQVDIRDILRTTRNNVARDGSTFSEKIDNSASPVVFIDQ